MNLPAEQADIALTVWQLRQRGATTNEIARQLGVPTSRVGALLRQELLQASHDLAETTRQELLALELARLDNLQSANWDMALQGDTRAGELCLKVMDRRAKLLGIDQNQTEDTANFDKSSTVLHLQTQIMCSPRHCLVTNPPPPIHWKGR